MELQKNKPQLRLVMNEKEIKWLRDVSQNAVNQEESEQESKIRLEFYVHTSRALGYAVNDDGTANRSISGHYQGN